MQYPNIPPLDDSLVQAIQTKIDTRTKPPGSLGRLEELAMQVCRIQKTLTPAIQSPAMVVFAADHGIAKEGVSAFPSEVTVQMVLNFLNNGAAINVFTRHVGMELQVVDAGVDHDFGNVDGLVHRKVRRGTGNFLREPAMTDDELQRCLEEGGQVVQSLHAKGCNTIGFGEMGIANTSAAAVLLSLLGPVDLEKSVGAGTGLDSEGIRHKHDVLQRAIAHHQIDPKNPAKVLSTFGGLEIAMMTGAMLKAANLGMIVLVDGFIASSAALAAWRMVPEFLDYAVFCHKSMERGHAEALRVMGVDPILHLDMRLGEGTGAALALPVIQNALAFLNEMASFADAGVSDGN